MSESNGSQRATYKRRHANPVFNEMLQCLYRDALANQCSILPYLEQAISSLEKYPLPLSSGAECAILKGFDQRLCTFIDSHMSRLPPEILKIKFCDSGFLSDQKVKKPKLSPSGANISRTAMNSNAKRKHKKNKKLQTNTEKCPFQSKFGESSRKRVAQPDSPLDNVRGCNKKTTNLKSSTRNETEKVQQSERNNNTATKKIQQSENDKNTATEMILQSENDNNTATKNIQQSENVNNTATKKIQLTEKNNNAATAKIKQSENDNNTTTKKIQQSKNDNITAAKKTQLSANDNTETKKIQQSENNNNTATKKIQQSENVNNTTTKKIQQSENVNNRATKKIQQSENDTNTTTKKIQQSENNNNTVTKKIQQSEKNNNTAIDIQVGEYSEHEVLDTYFINRSEKDSANSKQNNEAFQDFYSCNNFALCENWDTFTNNDEICTTKPRPKIGTVCPLIEVLDLSGDDHSVTDHSASDMESISHLNNQCFHNKETIHCKQCECILTAADAFQLYYKEKTKRDAEEIEKCVLPRKFYKPAYRSATYAILVALLEQRNECPYRDCLTKDELIQKAQKHTDQSFFNSKPGSTYTAWTNAKRLINKGMIQITNFDDKDEDFYMLTAMGRTLAMELIKEITPKVTVNDVIFHGQRNDRVPSLEDVVLVPPPPSSSMDDEQSSVFIEMPPGTFDIVMLIDKREHFDKNFPTKPNNYCKYEVRNLTVGDFLWVARSRKTGQELVLPYIIERKRMDDLASSIKDGRFHEQKFRLRKCGLRNVHYLVENYKKNGQYALPMATLMQAVANTSVLEEFNVVKTDSLEHTFRFLESLSEILVHEFLPVFLRGSNRDTEGKELMTFDFFNKFSNKNKALTVRDTFIKMLLQLKGLSIEKALSITKKYSTPRLLMKAYEECSVKEGELLLANLKFNNLTRNVGPAVSKTVYKLFSKQM